VRVGGQNVTDRRWTFGLSFSSHKIIDIFHMKGSDRSIWIVIGATDVKMIKKDAGKTTF
jgi:hypothetical protein